jgi:hypothetical protein
MRLNANTDVHALNALALKAGITSPGHALRACAGSTTAVRTKSECMWSTCLNLGLS